MRRSDATHKIAQLGLVAMAWALLWWLGLSRSYGASTSRRCVTLFAQKKYVAACRCFEKLIPASLTGLSKQARIAMGRRLRNASTSYQAAARRAKDPAQASYYLERAWKLLDLSLRHKLHENPRRKQQALQKQKALRQAISYATLTVITSHPMAQIKLKGYRYSRQKQGRRWREEVRPGRYQIEVLYPNSKQRLRQQVQLSPGGAQQVELTLAAPSSARSTRSKPTARRSPSRRRAVARRLAVSPPPRRPQPKPPARAMGYAGWSLVGIGAAAAVVSAITFGVGSAAADQRSQLHQQALANPTLDHTEQIQALTQQGEAMYTTSLVGLITAGAAIGVGGALLIIQAVRRKAPPQPPKAPTQGSALILSK